MLKNKKIGKNVILKFLLGITLLVLTALILRSGFVGATLSDKASGAGRRSSSQPAQGCDREPTGVDTKDYFISFNVPTGLMPAPQFDGKPARFEVHSVRPLCAHSKCPDVPNHAIVFIHGRSIPGPVVFDTQHTGEKISLQESLARAGIDTFAPSLLGYGRSTRFSLDDPCNASLPAYTDGRCSVPTIGCDRSFNQNIFPLNQQDKQLAVNPLAHRMCRHSSGQRFATIDVWARDVCQVIDDVIGSARPADGKVVLIGESVGGVTVARALYKLGHEAAKNKVQRVVFLSSFFDRLAGEAPVNLPTEESDLPPAALSTSFPLALLNLPSAEPSQGPPDCAGRAIPRLDLRKQYIELDKLGSRWSGKDPANPTGLLRAPTFSNYGWNPKVAASFDIPTFVLHGFLDDITPVSNSDHIYDALTIRDKALVQVKCAGHAMMWEGCSGARCDDGNPHTKPYGGHSQKWAGPYSTVAAALIEWVNKGTFNEAPRGRFVINGSGVVNN